jgi:steroid delta-isomerase-like uncharacterized protein
MAHEVTTGSQESQKSDAHEEHLAHEMIEAFNRHDAEGMAALYAEDAVFVDPIYPVPLRGREAVRKDWQDLFDAFPDAKVELGDAVARQDRLAFQAVVRATHTGPLATPEGQIPPTGRRIELRGCHFLRRSEDGRIATDHRYYDVAGLLAQLHVDVH